MRRLELIGVKKNSLLVMEEQGKKVLCACDCGEVKLVGRGNFLAGYTTSCGCRHRQATSKANTTHGLSKSQIYTVWKAMMARCYNPQRASYPWYGGKGIKVCAEWQDFTNFMRDMGGGYLPGLTVDRLDSSKDYSKSNCQWLTKSENSQKGSGNGACS